MFPLGHSYLGYVRRPVTRRWVHLLDPIGVSGPVVASRPDNGSQRADQVHCVAGSRLLVVVGAQSAWAGCTDHDLHNCCIGSCHGGDGHRTRRTPSDMSSRGILNSGIHYGGDKEIAERRGWIWDSTSCVFFQAATPTTTTTSPPTTTTQPPTTTTTFHVTTTTRAPTTTTTVPPTTVPTAPSTTTTTPASTTTIGAFATTTS